MNIPPMMQAVGMDGRGSADVLSIEEMETPRPGPGQILVELHYAGVNRPDILQRLGRYEPPPGASRTLGLEGSGRVVGIGEGVTRWSPGDEVTALFPGGGYAQYAVTHETHALPVPAGMDLQSAAGLCETLFTVWSNVFDRGRLRSGETLLVHGGTSGIGTMAIQLAREWGATVHATAGSKEKCDACRRLGATHAINYRERDFVEVMKELGGADVILDMVGGDYFARNVEALATDGRLCQIAVLGGKDGALDISQLIRKRLTLTGSNLRPQSDEAKAEIARQLREKVWPILERGAVAPVVDSVFAFSKVADAHQRMESSEHIGKLLLKIR